MNSACFSSLVLSNMSFEHPDGGNPALLRPAGSVELKQHWRSCYTHLQHLLSGFTHRGLSSVTMLQTDGFQKVVLFVTFLDRIARSPPAGADVSGKYSRVISDSTSFRTSEED